MKDYKSYNPFLRIDFNEKVIHQRSLLENYKMAEKKKMLKIKVGEVWNGKESLPVFQTAYETKSKKGDTYFVVSNPIFVQEYEKKEGKSL